MLLDETWAGVKQAQAFESLLRKEGLVPSGCKFHGRLDMNAVEVRCTVICQKAQNQWHCDKHEFSISVSLNRTPNCDHLPTSRS